MFLLRLQIPKLKISALYKNDKKSVFISAKIYRVEIKIYNSLIFF